MPRLGFEALGFGSGSGGGGRVIASGSSTLAAGATATISFNIQTGEQPTYDLAGYVAGTPVDIGFGLALSPVLSNPGADPLAFELALKNNTSETLSYSYVIKGVSP